MNEIAQVLYLHHTYGYSPKLGGYVSSGADISLAAYIFEPELYLKIAKISGPDRSDAFEALALKRVKKAWAKMYSRYKAQDLKGKHDLVIDLALTYHKLYPLPGLIGHDTFAFINKKRKFLQDDLGKHISTALVPLRTGLNSKQRMELYSSAFDSIYPESAKDLIQLLEGNPPETPIYWTGSLIDFNKFCKQLENILTNEDFQIVSAASRVLFNLVR